MAVNESVPMLYFDGAADIALTVSVQMVRLYAHWCPSGAYQVCGTTQIQSDV